eukprot:gene8761-14788_t
MIVHSLEYIDPCLTNYLREDNWQRSLKYNASINTPKHCDNAVANKWFRFVSKAGITIPTACPKPYACGTAGSVWLKGTYPNQVGQQIGVPVCARTPTECCKQSWNIVIKKCHVGGETFFLHRLPSVPRCPMSYCAGTEVPCPPGYNSKTGYTPDCVKLFPPVTNVRLYHGIEEKRLKFVCEFSNDEVNDTDIFEVTWWQGAPAVQINKVDILRGAERKAILRNMNRYPEPPLFYLGTTISCRVRSWFEHKNNTKSRYVESNHFFAGIKDSCMIISCTLINVENIQVYPEQLKFRLSEAGSPLKLMVKSTVPIICEKFHGCFVLVEIGQTGSDSLVDVCSLKFDPGKANQTKEIQVVALRDFVNDGDHTMYVKFHIFDHIDPVDWNLHKRIPDIQIMSVDVGTERCTTTGDPHLTTFDKFYYHHYQVGDYVLVNSTCRKFEVHVRTWKCASVSCNCGVAAREGDDVIVVDMCRDKIPRARFASTVEPHPDTKLQRNRNGKSFEISFPSGAFIRVDMHRWIGNLWYANIQVQVVSDDFKCTQGLCGTFDRNKDNELTASDGQVVSGRHGSIAPTQFTESWKIPTGESLFYYRGGPRKCHGKRVKHYCSCQEDCCGKRKVNCDFTNFQKRPKYKKGKQFWKDLNFPGGRHCGRRKRRSTADAIILPDDEESLWDYVYAPEPLKAVVSNWPTPLGKTLAQTRAYCDQQLRNSEIAKICSKLLDVFDVTDFVTECISDVQISDNFTFVYSALEKMKNFCEEISLKDLTIWKKDPSKNGTLEPPTVIENVLCPNQCSGNGICVNATCKCNNGFVTADCSIRRGEEPVVLTNWPQRLDGLCDMRKRDCTSTRVSGYNFIDSEGLKCRIHHAEPKDGGYVKLDKTDVNQAFLLSFGEIMCELDKLPTNVERYGTGEKGIPVAAMYITVANDAKNYSKGQSLHAIYDSKCMNCSLNETCYKRTDLITCTPKKTRWNPVNIDIRSFHIHHSDEACSDVDRQFCELKGKESTCLINGFCFNKEEANPLDYCALCDPLENEYQFSTRKAHSAPVIVTETRSRRAVVGQEFSLQMEAYDPYNQTITFKLKEDYKDVSITYDGLLKWKPKHSGIGSFTVVAVGRCGNEASLKLLINATLCTCNEQAVCILMQNGTDDRVICKCIDGCTGPLCSEPLPGKECSSAKKPRKLAADESNTAIIVIPATIAAVLLLAIVLFVYYFRKRQQNRKQEEEDCGNNVAYSKKNGIAKVFENDIYASTATLT